MIEQDRPDVTERPWSSDEVPWSILNLDELADAFWTYIAPAARRDGLDPENERPSYEWLSEQGFRGLVYALREYHDKTFADFWGETLGLEAEESYDWGVEHEETLEELQRFLDVRLESKDSWGEETYRTNRYRLARYARAHRDMNGTDDLLSRVAPDSDVPEHEPIDDCRDTFRYLSDELSGATVARIHDIVREWYADLVDRRRAGFNPTDGIERIHDWDRSSDEADPVGLAADQVGALMDAARTTKEELLVVALSAWGLRSGEVASLRVTQLAFDENPSIDFEERKNGPGTVAVVYGVEVAQDRVGMLYDREDWDGYLFPSARSETGHAARQTVAKWFHDLADRADIPEEIAGVGRKPHMGRRFWYDCYSSTMEDVLEYIEGVAAEQGSTSGETVRDRYLTEERGRELRRQFMREKLSEVFEPTQSDSSGSESS